MRHLILMRHAKTENRNLGGDHARQLVPRGREDCALLVKYLQANQIIPDHVVSSDATRTRETVAQMQPALVPGCGITFLEQLYLAEPEEILQEIHSAPTSSQTLLVTGHNPGIHMLAFSLMDRKQRQLRSDLAGNFPTSAAAVFAFAADNWTGIEPGGGTLNHFITAKSLRPASDAVLDDDDEWR
ncbi:MAG: histidine phosphatase family protein [Beijerinckiaceae bacterium]|jgi:phosphohistidine phosphatase|nr:histidine phosphatase family protein [Beijerinckiaceae bacterium]